MGKGTRTGNCVLVQHDCRVVRRLGIAFTDTHRRGEPSGLYHRKVQEEPRGNEGKNESVDDMYRSLDSPGVTATVLPEVKPAL